MFESDNCIHCNTPFSDVDQHASVCLIGEAQKVALESTGDHMKVDQETLNKIAATIAGAMQDAIYDSKIQKELEGICPPDRAYEAAREITQLIFTTDEA